MVVDKQRLENKIYFVKKNLKKLNELKEESEENFLSDYKIYDSAKYNLQVSIEALVDIGNHIISRESFDLPETNADTFKILVNENIISKDRLKSYIAMAKFRNMVVHLYDKIDEEEIYNIVQNHLDDFDYFIKQVVERYLIENIEEDQIKSKEDND